MEKYICPICGYDELEKIPYYGGDCPSYEICECCGFEYGFDDGSEGHTFTTYRRKWILEGAEWFVSNSKSNNWDLEKQLANINLTLDKIMNEPE